jgi:hypothetical protein
MSWTGIGPVVVTTPGTKVPLSATDIRCEGILIQALANAAHTNTGRVYLFDRNGVRIATLPIPTTNAIPAAGVTLPASPGGMNARDYTIDADVGTDGVDASYLRP